MLSTHSDENRLENNEMNGSMQQDEDEERLRISSPIFDDSLENVLNDNSYSNDDNGEIFYQSSSDFIDGNAQSSLPDTRQISTALALFRHRHHLSKSCINDLCDLLRSLGVPNVPFDFRSIERNITQNRESILKGAKFTVCPTCGTKGISSSKCENVRCRSKSGFLSTPTTLCVFKLLPQITSILERHNILPETNGDDVRIADIQQARIRRNILRNERISDPEKRIVTLLLNSDGVVLKKISRSIWITSLIINELPRNIRFNTNNLILCSISIGANKPKKDQFQSFIVDWVQELRQLELGFYVCFPNSNNEYRKVHAYLIAAALDKPAQALIANINEPIGFYSCVRCTIRGK